MAGQSPLQLPVETLSQYDVTWTTPSENWYGTMPLGNGDIGLNLMVNAEGEVEFYMSKGDSWDDLGRLAKLAKGTLKLSPKPNLSSDFSQTLSLIEGAIHLQLGEQQIRVWIDAQHPVLRIDITSATPVNAELVIDLWREVATPLQNIGWSDLYHQNNLGIEPEVQPDTVIRGLENKIGWYHFNKYSPWETILEVQGLEDIVELGYEDPLKDRIFGVLASGPHFSTDGALTLKSTEARNQLSLDLIALTQTDSHFDAWWEAINNLYTENHTLNRQEAWEQHCQWWYDFWNRSWIFLDGTKDARKITQGYVLQRFMLGAAARSEQPAKFNGSLFTVPFQGDPDYRRWGPGYWHQNTRLLYWPMLASGDFDMMQPFFKMYQDALPLAELRTQRYFSHDGAYMPECMHFWGLEFPDVWGWTPLSERPDREDRNSEVEYLTYHRQGGLETATMMLEYYDYTLDTDFLENTAIPFANSILTFYFEHYSRGPAGDIDIYPAHALETWWDARNPMPEIAGLYRVLEKLLELPTEFTQATMRKQWSNWLDELPPLPTRSIAGKTALAPAASFDIRKNAEAPELYAVFPYEFYMRGKKEDLSPAIIAYQNRLNRQSFGWPQDEIWAAKLGLANEARNSLAQRASNYHLGKAPGMSRFPAFWGPNYDWTPDQDHGSVLMIALQDMLIDSVEGTLTLLPAWPKEWQATFKLHAPGQTVVTGKVLEGELLDLAIQSNRNDPSPIVYEAQQTTLKGPGALREDKIPPEYNLIAEDNLGNSDTAPNLVQGDTFEMQIAAPEHIRTIAFHPEAVTLNYALPDTQATYGLRVLIASDGSRSMRITVNGQNVAGPVAVDAGQYQDIFIPLDDALTNAGKISVSIETVSGPNAVVSLVELYQR